MLYARKEQMPDGGERVQTLAEHSHAVENRAGAACSEIGLEAVGRLAGVGHDAGKSPLCWQEYLLQKTQKKMVPHSLPGAAFLERQFKGRDGRGEKRLRQMLALAVQGHHGGLRDVLQPDGTSCIPDYAEAEIDSAVEANFFCEVISRQQLDALFDRAAKEEAEFNKKLYAASEQACAVGNSRLRLNAYQNFRGLSERFLYSALIDADRSDAARWEDGGRDDAPPAPDWAGMAARLAQSVEALPSAGKISALRQKIARTCRTFEADSHGVYRAFVPTGGGKTLSVMAFALNMAEKYRKKHIYFIEPFLTILEQNAADVRQKCGAGDAVFEHHSNVVIEDDERGEKLAAYQRRTEHWDAPIVFTSLVQLLDALYSGNSAAARRMSALANSVLIIDEVQAVPQNSLYLFNLGINFLTAACGCIVVLCTATPPALEQLPYPLRQLQDIVPDTAALYRAFLRTRIDADMACGKPREAEELAAFLAEKQAAEGSVLAIMNTKGIAGKLCAAVRGRVPQEVPVFYLSTLLCAAHRSKKLEEIRALLNAGRPVVCVTTQLIEAGVDISFPCVVRALAGLDSILQAAGRCNRHGTEDCKTVYVVKCAGEERALSRLPEIQTGQKATMRLLDDLKNGFYGGDLQSPEAICAYYGYYYAGARANSTMAYLMPGFLGKQSAVELLGINGAARDEYRKESGVQLELDQLAQSFQTAGRNYHPIPEDTIGVLVPWDEEPELVEQLRGAKEPQTRAALLRRLQRFAVNLFRRDFDRLYEIGAIAEEKELGVFLLDKDHYKEEFGVVFDEYGSVDAYIVDGGHR